MSDKLRAASALFAAAIIFSAAACGESSEPSAQAQQTAAQAGESVPAAEETTAETSILDTLPTGLDFEGYEIHILAPASLDETYAAYLMPEEENGDILNDTAYRRNRDVEERYNVKLVNSFIDGGQLTSTLNKSVTAGSDDYQYCHFGSAWESPISLIKSGALMNLREMPELNLDSPGFYTEFTNELTINNRSYVAFSQYGNAGALPLYMVFNKNMIADYGLDLPYQAIFDGVWTWDMFQSYIKNVYSDINGNGKKDKEDRFGYGNNAGLCNYLVWGFDIHVVTRTDDGGYTSDILNQKFVEAAQKIIDFKSGDDIFVPSDINATNTDDRHMFLFGNVMFTNVGTFSLDGHLRGIETFDFGIAPDPKLDESQQKYSNYHALNEFAVPVTVGRPDAVAYVVEGLAAISKADLAPAFIDVYFQEKLLRDEESKQVAALLMEQSAIDPTRYFDFASGNITPVTLLSKVKNSNEVVSKFTSINESAQKKAGDFFAVFFE